MNTATQMHPASTPALIQMLQEALDLLELGETDIAINTLDCAMETLQH